LFGWFLLLFFFFLGGGGGPPPRCPTQKPPTTHKKKTTKKGGADLKGFSPCVLFFVLFAFFPPRYRLGFRKFNDCLGGGGGELAKRETPGSFRVKKKTTGIRGRESDIFGDGGRVSPVPGSCEKRFFCSSLDLFFFFLRVSPRDKGHVVCHPNWFYFQKKKTQGFLVFCF